MIGLFITVFTSLWVFSAFTGIAAIVLVDLREKVEGHYTGDGDIIYPALQALTLIRTIEQRSQILFQHIHVSSMNHTRAL